MARRSCTGLRVRPQLPVIDSWHHSRGSRDQAGHISKTSRHGQALFSEFPRQRIPDLLGGGVASRNVAGRRGLDQNCCNSFIPVHVQGAIGSVDNFGLQVKSSTLV